MPRRGLTGDAREMRREYWLLNHSELDEWYRNASDSDLRHEAFLLNLRRFLVDNGYLTGGQIRYAQQAMERATGSGLMPGEYDPLNLKVHNGLYVLEKREPGHDLSIEAYKIHTIRRTSNAPMMNKRVISRSPAPTTNPHWTRGWTSFAFINHDGLMDLWRRFRADQDENYVKWAVMLVRHLADNRERPFLRNQETGGESQLLINSRLGSFLLSSTRTCIRCNSVIADQPSALDSGIGLCCLGYVGADDRYHRGGIIEDRVRPQPHERAIADSATSAPAASPAPARSRSPRNRQAPSTTPYTVRSLPNLTHSPIRRNEIQ